MPRVSPEQPSSFLGAESPKAQAYLLANGDSDWLINNSSLADYSRSANFFGHPEGLSGIIAAQIGTQMDNVGLDIAAGSSAQALRDLLDSGVLKMALATNLEDRRPAEVAADERLGHVAGDLTKPDTWDKITGWTEQHAPQGLALVMHRPVGGLRELPASTYRGAAHFLLDLVRPGGLMFTQIPTGLTNEPRVHLETCRTIRERPDVASVIPSEPFAESPPDLSNHYEYVVILKKS